MRNDGAARIGLVSVSDRAAGGVYQDQQLHWGLFGRRNGWQGR